MICNLRGLLCEPWGTQGRVGVEIEGADAPKEISVEKEKNDLKIEDALKHVVELEQNWYYLYNKYVDYYLGIQEFEVQHRQTMLQLCEVYFGETVGSFLYNNVCYFIHKENKEERSSEEIVRLLYSIYWPDPERVVKEAIEEFNKDYLKESAKRRQQEWDRLELIAKKSKEFGIEEHELLTLANKIVNRIDY